MTDNLELWKLVEKTDPKQVKAITGKPYKGNSPKPHYLVQKATETFGPCGIGWGFEILNERVEDGAAGDKIHIAHIGVWYEWKDKRGKVQHVGQTMLAGKRRDGSPYTDEDAPKKSVTDALVKALSMIGFAGDIFMGRYDDSKYVDEIGQEFAEQARTTKSSAQLKRENFWPDFERELDECATLLMLEKFRGVWGQKAVKEGWTAAWKSAARDRIEGREKLIMDEMDAEQLAEIPLGDALRKSIAQHPVNSG